MSTLDAVLSILSAALLVVSGLLARSNRLIRRRTPAGRASQRDALAASAVAYAEQMGGDNSAKLLHAISAFERLDLADNGKRDFTPAEARIAIEAALTKGVKNE